MNENKLYDLNNRFATAILKMHDEVKLILDTMSDEELRAYYVGGMSGRMIEIHELAHQELLFRGYLNDAKRHFEATGSGHYCPHCRGDCVGIDNHYDYEDDFDVIAGGW